MNKAFWDSMVVLWCDVTSTAEIEEAAEIAVSHAKKIQQKQSGYSENPLDDYDDDEEDDFL